MILTHTLDGEIQPLNSVPASERPPVKPVFYAFRVMVGLGTAMLLLVLASLWLWWRGRLYESRAGAAGWRVMMLAGFVALLPAGTWSRSGASPTWSTACCAPPTRSARSIAAASVMTSLIVYALVYAIVFGAGIWYLRRLVVQGPHAARTAAAHRARREDAGAAAVGRKP